MSIDNQDDMIDSRDVIERIAELRNEWAEATGDDPADYAALSEDDWQWGLGEDGAHELVSLESLADQCARSSDDWQDGATLIRDSYFKEYAMDLAEDIGAVDHNAGWPMSCIDWEQAARELRMDYTPVEFDGVTYWTRD